MTIYTLTLANLGGPCQKLADGLEVIPLDEGQPDRTVQLGREIDNETRHVLINLLREYQDIFVFYPEEMLD